jgi:hypothetical protein
MIVEKQMECRLAGETEVLGENLPQRHFFPSQNHPGRLGGKPATNRLSYGDALSLFFLCLLILNSRKSFFSHLLHILLWSFPLVCLEDWDIQNYNFNYCGNCV